jgi:hypothetical protein
MVYARDYEVKNLIHNFTIKNAAGTDITTTVVTDAIGVGDSDAKLESGYSDWLTTDTFYPTIQEASEYFAAAYILERYFKSKQYKDEAMQLYQKALDRCASISSSTGVGVLVAHKPYKSYPLNKTTGTIHRSLHNNGGDSLAGED